MLIFHFLRPNFELINLSYEEKMEQTYEEKMELIEIERINPYKIFNFINDTVDEGSTVLYFDYYYWILGKPYLYPYVISDYIEYTDDEELFEYLDENTIDYLIIIEKHLHLSNYTDQFKKIEYESDIYLLKII